MEECGLKWWVRTAAALAGTAFIALVVTIPVLINDVTIMEEELALQRVEYMEMSNVMWDELMTQNKEIKYVRATRDAQRHRRQYDTSDSAKPAGGDYSGVSGDSTKPRGHDQPRKPLVCPPGPPGPRGAAGDNGENGEDGIPGLPGNNGGEGANSGSFAPSDNPYETSAVAGSTCAPCPAGPPGLPGYKGKRGQRGEKGAKGMPGNAGRDGEIGEEGPEGELGYQGDLGQPGEKGAPGEDGIGYAKGAPGAKGETGPPGMEGDEGMPGERGDDAAPGPKAKPDLRDLLASTAKTEFLAFLERLEDTEPMPSTVLAPNAPRAREKTTTVDMVVTRTKPATGRDLAELHSTPCLHRKSLLLLLENTLNRTVSTTSALALLLSVVVTESSFRPVF
ncbi:hypothetical protein L596_006139 [Steinernema carpocapsae]|uniref:Nematode cuticle collagen N-terminal domain-containing protein n=1 Tax=Steinernema carpocapsae TaxID=34508 RepID=A0A4U8V8H9_STECR|nr:hypothetical protein L596_006139 [Steinernema carpocapsae]